MHISSSNYERSRHCGVEMSEEPELEQRPQSRREWHGIWRSLVLPLFVVGGIVAAIWYLNTGRSLPVLGGSDQSVDQQNDTYFSLKSQGIKLGASGGGAPKKGEMAPDFTLVDLEGNVVRLSDLR